MNNKTITRTLLLILAIGVALWPIRFGTVLILWLKYGESAQGSIDSDKVYQILPIRHLPIVLPIILLIYQTVRRKLWISDSEKLKSNTVAGLSGIGLYLLFEWFEVFDGT
jgi:hypothetical protein